MKYLVFLFAALLAGASAFASAPPKIVLLTSLETPASIWRSSSWSLPAELETDFRNAFGQSGYTIEVKHSVTASELAQVLESPDTIGVFWVSHAASATSDAPLGLDSLILDENGIDVSAVFQKVHPNLRWLSVIGCKAKPIFDQWTKEGFYAGNPELHLFAFDSLVDAHYGLITAMNESLDTLADLSRSDTYRQVHFGDNGVANTTETNYPPTIAGQADLIAGDYPKLCPRERGFPITVIRTPREAGETAEVQFFLGDRFLGILPASRTEQKLKLEIPKGALVRGEELKIKVDSRFGGILVERPDFGAIRFESALPSGGWKLFSDRNGKPIGVSNELFRYVENDAAAWNSPHEYFPFPCAANQ